MDSEAMGTTEGEVHDVWRPACARVRGLLLSQLERLPRPWRLCLWLGSALARTHPQLATQCPAVPRSCRGTGPRRCSHLHPSQWGALNELPCHENQVGGFTKLTEVINLPSTKGCKSKKSTY